MVYTIPKEEIIAQLLLQLRMHFLLTEEEQTVIERRFEHAIAACEENFSHSANKYFFTEVWGGKILQI